jgi:hypothetical protein
MGILRILLAVCVFCNHSQPIGNLRWLGGDLAVELFLLFLAFTCSSSWVQDTPRQSWEEDYGLLSFMKRDTFGCYPHMC